jgi:hypothetical protein
LIGAAGSGTANAILPSLETATLENRTLVGPLLLHIYGSEGAVALATPIPQELDDILTAMTASAVKRRKNFIPRI